MLANIYIRDSSSLLQTFQVDLKSLIVQNLFQLYSKKTGKNITNFDLIFGGRKLSDNKSLTLQKLDIQNQSFIYCINCKEQKKEKKSNQCPPQFICPISQQIMKDPVILQSGQTYDRSSVTEWFLKGKRTDPLTNKQLKSTNLITNYSLKNAIQNYLEANKNNDQNSKLTGKKKQQKKQRNSKIPQGQIPSKLNNNKSKHSQNEYDHSRYQPYIPPIRKQNQYNFRQYRQNQQRSQSIVLFGKYYHQLAQQVAQIAHPEQVLMAHFDIQCKQIQIIQTYIYCYDVEQLIFYTDESKFFIL